MRLLYLTTGVILAALLCHVVHGEPKSSSVNFGRDILPLLSDTCFTCHGPDEESRDSELRLDTKEGAFADLGGYRAILPGDVRQSELIHRIISDDPEERMPPPDAGRQLSEKQIELIKAWIEQGAKWEEHWAFVAPVESPLPTPANSTMRLRLISIDLRRRPSTFPAPGRAAADASGR